MTHYSAGLLDGQRLVIATYAKVAELIEADFDPGLQGEALDAWNAASMRAANLIRAVVFDSARETFAAPPPHRPYGGGRIPA